MGNIYSKSQTTVIGLDELIQAFMELGDKALPHLKDASNSAAEIVLFNVRGEINDKSGDLSAALKVYKAGKSAKYPYRVFSKVSAPANKIDYLRAVELGHPLVRNGKIYGRVKQHPFMRPGADKSKDAVVKEIAQGLNDAISQMGGMKL